jgi:hypothetical protein
VSQNRTRLVDAMQHVPNCPQWTNGGAILLQGGVHNGRYGTDTEAVPFRQVYLLSEFFHVCHVFRNRISSGHLVLSNRIATAQ